MRWHLLAVVCACRSGAVRDDASPRRVADAAIAIDAAVDASTIDAMQFALFDHLAVRQVRRVPGAKAPAIVKHKPKLDDKLEHVDAPPMPPWLQRKIGKQPITLYNLDEDGRSVVIADRLVALIDAGHRVELALDFDGVHSERAGEPDTVVSASASFALVDAHRVGDIVVVSAADPLSDVPTFRLIGVDVTTGAILWQSAEGVTADGFALMGGYAITSNEHVLRLFEADTGKPAGTVRTTGGPYVLDVVDGQLRDITRTGK